MPSRQQRGVLDQRKAAGALFGLEADPVFQRLLEEVERWQVARAQAQAFQVQQLHEGDERQQRNRRSGSPTATAMHHRLHPLDQAVGQPEFATASAFPRGPCGRGRSRGPCPAGGARRGASEYAVPASREMPKFAGLRARARAREMARSPSGRVSWRTAACGRRGTKARRSHSPCRGTRG